MLSPRLRCNRSQSRLLLLICRLRSNLHFLCWGVQMVAVRYRLEIRIYGFYAIACCALRNECVEIPRTNSAEMNFYEIVCFNDGGWRCCFDLGRSFRGWRLLIFLRSLPPYFTFPDFHTGRSEIS